MSYRLPKDEQRVFTRYMLEVKRYGAARNIPFSRRMALRRQVKYAGETPPLCACGCGEQVCRLRKTWSWYAKGHQPKPGASPEACERARQRMLVNNPMSHPEIAAKMGAGRRGKPIARSVEGRRNIANAARKRMLTNNPMKKAESFSKSNSNRITSMERIVLHWFKGLPIQFAADGTGFIESLAICPDFLVIGQIPQRVMEFGTGKSRGSRYAKQRIRKYASVGRECLVVLTDHLLLHKKAIMRLVRHFTRLGGSGAWKNGTWIGYDVSTDRFEYSTFHAARQRRT